jgi:hypothetical protein
VLQGTYEGKLQGGIKQLPATTAAAVAAAARALSSTEQWDSMQMELEVTHTVHSKAYTWTHITLLGTAPVIFGLLCFDNCYFCVAGMPVAGGWVLRGL